MKSLKLKLKTKLMKKYILIAITTIFFLACSSSSKSQTTIIHSENSEMTFSNQLEQTLTTINTQKTLDELFASVNKLKRLSALYPNEWLSEYYIAFLDIKLSLSVVDTDKKLALLKEAKEKIEVLKNKENTNESEIITLDGYYYYSKIALDPQKNGQLYYQDVISAYQKAKTIDKNNPRPALMLYIFQYNMSKFVGGSNENICSELEQIALMFKNFIPIDKLQPKWGEIELKQYQEKENCSQESIRN